MKAREEKTRAKQPASEGEGATPEAAPSSLIQRIAGDMKRGFLLLGLGLGAVSIAAAFLGALPVASMLAAIVLVSLTLYVFLRLWPEEEVQTPSEPAPDGEGMSKFQPGLRSMAAGSLPQTDPATACQLSLERLDIPTWPQLPRRSFLENMYVQFSERFPGVVVKDERIYVDRDRDLDSELEQLYVAYLTGDPDYAAIAT